MSDHSIVNIWVLKIFFVQSALYSCHLFLVSSASLRLVPLFSFIEPMFAWNVPSVWLIFLRGSLVFPFLLLSSIYLHWILRKAFFSLLANLWNTAFRCLYHSFSPFLFTSLLFIAIFKASPDNNFAVLHFISMRIVLIPVSCAVSRTSVHSSSCALFIESSPLNIFLTSTV